MIGGLMFSDKMCISEAVREFIKYLGNTGFLSDCITDHCESNRKISTYKTLNEYGRILIGSPKSRNLIIRNRSSKVAIVMFEEERNDIFRDKKIK